MGGPYGPVGAVVAAAGRGVRMGGVDKVFLSLGEKPLIAWPLLALERSPLVDVVVLVVASHNLGRARELVQALGVHKVQEICPGGERRQDSVRLGLQRLKGVRWVLVHDGARPFLTQELIAAALEAAQDTGAAVPALTPTDTVKEAHGDLVARTLDRSRLRLVQTPQAFRYELLMEAYLRAGAEATDDASLVEALGHPVRLFPGSPSNIKVTTAYDLALARALLTAGEVVP
jgi:2-C-methyl-D-erythritol 4-phosphate cytidylyltransferase